MKEEKTVTEAPAQPLAPTLITCTECDGEGFVYLEVGRDPDGAPYEKRFTCETCDGDGKVEMVCMECNKPVHESELSPSFMGPLVMWCADCNKGDD